MLTGGVEGVSLAQIGEARAAARIAEAAGYSLLPNPAIAANYADVDARERWYGRTALMIAAAEGHVDAVRLLVEAGSDLHLVDEEGSTALSLARSYGHLDVAALLAEAGARLELELHADAQRAGLFDAAHAAVRDRRNRCLPT